ncbi:MAG: glycosyltransferase family 4 protein [Planctomycetes bacterium]|nr:glycosyltransferase family 4 protein [Planctomycetota bacterium]
MSAPRVLVCGSVFGQPAGGVRRHNAELLPRAAALLEARGGALAVLEGRTPIAFPLPPSIERIPSDVPASPVLVRAAFESRALRRASGFDLVHTGHLPAPRGLRVPFTLTLHDLRHVEARRIFAASALAGALRRARGVFTVSECVRAELLERFRLDPARVRVVSNAADHFEPLPRAAQAGARLLCLGHLEPRKNQELVLRALALDPELPGVDFAGASKGRERERLGALAGELGLATRARFLGPFEERELPALYAHAALAVFPARIEGFSIGVLEALRAGCGVALSRIPAHLEVAGALVRSFAPDDARACAEAIRAALRDPPPDAAVPRRYSWEASARSLVEGWEAFLARS